MPLNYPHRVRPHHVGGCAPKLMGQCEACEVNRFRCKRKFKAICRTGFAVKARPKMVGPG